MRHFFLLMNCLIFFAIAFVQEGWANTKPFGIWVEEFKQEAMQEGISKQTLDNAFADVEPIDRIIELDRKQPESTLTLEQYLQKIISDDRISEGRRLYAENKLVLEKISAQFGVPAPYIVALWGIETSYGENTGNYGVIESLATLAYDGRRSEFFRAELIKALKIAESDHITADNMSGSWAGAMGQCQFMPSSFLNFAVDYDGDGKRDIWNTNEDVFASIANYLQSSGWNDDPQNNFNVLLKWNRSRYFATAVVQLAEAIGTP